MLEVAASVGMHVGARLALAFSINNQTALRQELVDHLDANLQVTAAVAAQIHQIALCPTAAQGDERIDELLIGITAEVIDADIAHIAGQIGSRDAVHGNVATGNIETEQLVRCSAADA